MTDEQREILESLITNIENAKRLDEDGGLNSLMLRRNVFNVWQKKLKKVLAAK